MAVSNTTVKKEWKFYTERKGYVPTTLWHISQITFERTVPPKLSLINA